MTKTKLLEFAELLRASAGEEFASKSNSPQPPKDHVPAVTALPSQDHSEPGSSGGTWSPPSQVLWINPRGQPQTDPSARTSSPRSSIH